MTSKLGPVAKAGGDLFIINLQDGRSIKSSDLKAGNVKFTALQPNPKAFRLADRFPGKAVSATFQALNGALRISWRAVLRDHSHYLRQELRLTCTKPIQMKNIIAMQYDLVEGKAGAPSVSGNARGALIVNDLAFTALETPMGINTVGGRRKYGRGRNRQLESGQVVHSLMDRKFQCSPGTEKAVRRTGFQCGRPGFH